MAHSKQDLTLYKELAHSLTHYCETLRNSVLSICFKTTYCLTVSLQGLIPLNTTSAFYKGLSMLEQ